MRGEFPCGPRNGAGPADRDCAPVGDVPAAPLFVGGLRRISGGFMRGRSFGAGG